MAGEAEDEFLGKDREERMGQFPPGLKLWRKLTDV